MARNTSSASFVKAKATSSSLAPFLAAATLAAATTVAIVVPLTTHAQDTTLGGFGETQLQQNTGDSVQRTCGGFVASGADPSIPLFATCRAMVHTANDLADNGGPSRDSLGLTSDELAASLQQIATEEFAATSSMASEMTHTRLDPVVNRLIELRNGARGFSVAGLYPENEDESIAQTGWQALGGAAAGGEPGGPLGGFANINYGTGDRDSTSRTDQFDYDSVNLVAGLDYRVSDSFVIGFSVNYYDVSADFGTGPTVSGGGIDTDGIGGSVYGSFYSGNFYLDLIAGIAESNYDIERSILIPSNTSISSISATARAGTDSTDVTAGVGLGYNFQNGALDWGPYLRITYLSVDVDGYEESGAESVGLNLRVDGQEWESLTATLGAQFNYAISQDFGVIVPYVRAGFVRQFENDSVGTTAVYIDDPRANELIAFTDDPDETYAELSIGLSAIFKGGMQGFLTYDTLIGFGDLSTNVFTLGLRFEL
ncbi:MAG: autotransporter outer membrane beta-barrel domain-containing protein [Pseudomonadota bacterium]